MPIVLIRQMSPLTVEVRDDDGNLVGKMTVPTDDATERDWVIRKAKGRPTETFRMDDREIELRTVQDDGAPHDRRQERH